MLPMPVFARGVTVMAILEAPHRGRAPRKIGDKNLAHKPPLGPVAPPEGIVP
jgi:hypothetical protein